MNRHWARIACLTLAVMLTLTVFGACKKDDNKDNTSDAASSNVASVEDSGTETSNEPAIEVVDDSQYYEVKDASIVTVITDNETNTTTMKVATGTTVEAFNKAVVAKTGYSYKILGADAKEVTKGAIAAGFKFEVYKDGDTTAVRSYKIEVVSKAAIASVVKEASKEASQAAAANKTSKTTSKTTNNRQQGNTANVSGSTSSSIKGYKFAFNTAYFDGRSGSSAEAKIYTAKIKAIDKKYGCKTTVTNDAGDSTAIANAVLAGKKYADIVEISLPAARALARSGAICNLYDSKTLNKSLFKTGLTESCTFKGKAYGVAFASMSANSMGVTFNKDLVKKYAPKYDIYSLYKQKKWDVNNYEAIMKACTVDTDGNGTYDIFGMTSNTNVIGLAITSYAGGTATKNSKNGYIEVVMCNSWGIKSLEWIKQVYKDKYWKYLPDANDAVSLFANGSAATFASYMSHISTISQTAKFDIGFVPFPMGTNPAFKKYITATYDGKAFVVPISNKSNLDKCGTWLNMIAQVSDSLVSMTAKQYTNFGLDANGVAVYRWSVSNTVSEYSTGVFSSAVSSATDTSVTSKAKSPSKVMGQIINKAQNELNDYYGGLTGQTNYTYNP